ncbi:MAG: cell division protease FtsH [Planctomycetota bacterium]|jgi:cell division protease FtsH
MPESPTPQGDRDRRQRPFGPFFLFLTILVVVLVAFGSSHLQRPRKMTQDEFWWSLYTGRIENVEIKGSNEVIGVLSGGEKLPFHVSFAHLEGLESHIQQINAEPRPRRIPAEAFAMARERKLFQPELVRHLTSTKEDSQPVTEGSEARYTSRIQTDVLLVRGTALAGDNWGSLADENLADLRAGSVWFEVRDAGEIMSLKADLAAAGTPIESLTFDITPGQGTQHSRADTTFGSLLIFWGPWILIFLVFMIFMRQMRNQGGGAGVMSFSRSRATLYNKENHTGVTFDDVAGAQEAKDEVREVVEFLKNPGRFTRIGGRIPRGVLLAGPPGCGKTLLAKAIAGEAEVPFFSISGSDFVEMFVGVGASRVRDLFKQARETSPCIIFLDEIDAVGRRRGSGMGGGHDEREQTLNAILVEMDGFGTDEGIIVVAATNRPDVLDPALLRPGRFDREVTIDLPDVQDRQAILNVHLKRVKLGDDADPSVLARSTPGYSGADLAAIVNEAAIMAVLDKEEEIYMRHLEEAATKIRYGRKKVNRKLEPEDLEITAFHESGHALVAAKLDKVDPPHKVTIVPRGRALGATIMLPTKETDHTQRQRLLGQLATLFGGRVAEEIFCGDISAGASDDIRRATDMARAMVTELGMSDKVGPINYAERRGSDFLGTELMGSKWHSETTSGLIDEEISRILREAYETATSLIKENDGAIRRMTAALLEYETLNAEEIQALIDGAEPSSLRPEKPEEDDEVAEVSAPDRTPNASQTPPEEDPGLPGGAGLSPA